MLLLVAGVYAILLSLLVFSSAITPALVDLFVAEPHALGTHGADWQFWQGTSCAFVAIVCLQARALPNRAQSRFVAATAFVYGVWGAQNLRLVLATDRYDAPMWLHVLLCLGLGAWGLASVLARRPARG